MTETTKLSISENILQTTLLCELWISWRKIPCVRLLSIYIEKRLQDMLNRDLCGQQNARINSSELMFFVMKTVPTWKYFEFEISPPYYVSFILKIAVIFGGGTKPDNIFFFAKQKIICKRHKVSNRCVLRFLVEFITETCSKIKYFKLAFNVFLLTHLSVTSYIQPLLYWFHRGVSLNINCHFSRWPYLFLLLFKLQVKKRCT